MPSIDVLGVPHAYELTDAVEGRPTFVFVHGWLLSRHYWQPLVQKLSPFYQCLTYDLRGFGASQEVDRSIPQKDSLSWQESLEPENLAIAHSPFSLGPHLHPSLHHTPTRYSPAAYAQDLVALLESLNLSKVWVVGHSLGGSIALWAGAIAPETVQGVVCLNSGGGIYVKEAFERFRGAGQQMIKFRPGWLSSVPLLHLAFSRIMVHRPLARHWGRQRAIDFVAAQPEAALQSLLDSTAPEQIHLLPQVVAQLQQPVYFLGGQEDQVMELKYVYHLASFHPSFRAGETNVIEIPNCGHMGMLERTTAIALTLQQLQEKHQPSFPYPSASLLG